MESLYGKKGGGAETEWEGKGAEETYFLWFRQVMKAVSSLKFDALSWLFDFWIMLCYEADA